MRILTRRLCTRINTGIVLLMLPLLALMPLLHGHPLGAIGTDHPVGVHFPASKAAMAASAAPAAGGAPAAAPGQGAAAEGGALATIIVQDARPRAAERRLSSQRATFIESIRASARTVDLPVRIGQRLPVERPRPWLQGQRPQAPPPGSATAAASPAATA